MSRLPRLLATLLVLALELSRPGRAARVPALRLRRRRLPARVGAPDTQDVIEAPDRARIRTDHRWAGEAIFWVGERRTVVNGRWRLTVDRAQRAQPIAPTCTPPLDPGYVEGWITQLGDLLTLQLPGARLAVALADARGWQLLELRAPTQPETVVQLDRGAVAIVLDAGDEPVRVELRVHA